MSALSDKMKMLDREIKKTDLLNTDLRAALNNIQYRLSMIPWWKYIIVFMFYWLVKLYVHTGWTSFATFAVSVAVSTNLILVIPRISDNIKDRFVPIAADTQNKISAAVVTLNKEEHKTNIVKKNPEIERAYKTVNIELITGDVYKGKLLSENAESMMLLITIEGKSFKKRFDKELVQRQW